MKPGTKVRTMFGGSAGVVVPAPLPPIGPHAAIPMVAVKWPEYSFTCLEFEALLDAVEEVAA